MHMADWVKKLDAFLEFNQRNILTHAGKISHELAEEHAHRQFARYDAERHQLEAQQATDFDKAIDGIKRLNAQPPASPKKPKRKGRR